MVVYHKETTWVMANHITFFDSLCLILGKWTTIWSINTFLCLWEGSVPSNTTCFCGAPLHTTFTTLHFCEILTYFLSLEIEMRMIFWNFEWFIAKLRKVWKNYGGMPQRNHFSSGKPHYLFWFIMSYSRSLNHKLLYKHISLPLSGVSTQ